MVIDIEALAQHTVHIHGKLRIGGIPLPFLPGEQREFNSLPRKFCRNCNLCAEHGVFAMTAPDPCSGNFLP